MTSGCRRCSSGWLQRDSLARRPDAASTGVSGGPDGESEIQAIDPATLEYRPPIAARLPSLEAAKSIASTGERIKTLFHGQDRVGAFLRATLAPTLVYCAKVSPDISHGIDDVDRVLQWGFGWELGTVRDDRRHRRPGGRDGMARERTVTLHRCRRCWPS